MKFKRNIYRIIIACFSFFFISMINANARVEGSGEGGTGTGELSIECGYSSGHKITYAGGKFTFTYSANELHKMDGSAIKISDFQKVDGGYYCPNTLYYSLVTKNVRDLYHVLTFDKKNTNLSGDKTSENITSPNDGTSSEYETCSYGSKGQITIRYNSTDLQIAHSGNSDQVVLKPSAASFADGCIPAIYYVSGRGYISYFTDDSGEGNPVEMKLYDPKQNTDYSQICKFTDKNGSPVKIYSNSKGDYYVESSLGCDSSTFDPTGITKGCGSDIYYNKTTGTDGKTVCAFTIDASKGYGSGGENDNPKTISCDDFVSDGENILSSIFTLMMIIAPILVIVFGGLDFAKATLASDEKEFKKAGTNFGKRLIAAVLLFLLPFIINLVLGIAFDAGVFGDNDIPKVCLDAE